MAKNPSKEITGIEALRSGLAEQGKSLSWLAGELSITRGAISQWDVVPAERVIEIERITNINRIVLRPDLYEGMVA